MKRIVTAFVIATSSLLGGCATTAPDGSVTTPDYAALIAQVQGYTQTACGFVPTAAFITNMVTGGNPGVVAALAMAQAICAAVNPPKALRMGQALAVKGWRVTPGAVNGVPISGSRTR